MIKIRNQIVNRSFCNRLVDEGKGCISYGHFWTIHRHVQDLNRRQLIELKNLVDINKEEYKYFGKEEAR